MGRLLQRLARTAVRCPGSPDSSRRASRHRPPAWTRTIGRLTLPRPSDDRITTIAFIGVILFAGVNAVAVRQSNTELAPFWGATLRFAAATALFALLAILWRVPFPNGRALVGAMLYGLFGFGIAYALLYFALQDAPAAVGQVALALSPLLTIPLAVAHRLERLRIRMLVGAAIATVGIIIVFADQLSLDVPIVSLVALVLASAAAAEAVIIPKAFPRTHPVSTNLVGMAVGAAFLLLLSVVTGERWSLPASSGTWLALGYLVVVGSVVVFLLVLFVLGRWDASTTSYQLLPMPIVTVIAAAVLRGEPITPGLIVGGAIVLAGVYIGVFARLPARISRQRVPADAEEVPITPSG